MDRKPVYLISNFHVCEQSEVLRTMKDGSRKAFACPKAVKDYNIYMGGVDKADFFVLCMVLTENLISGGTEFFSESLSALWPMLIYVA